MEDYWVDFTLVIILILGFIGLGLFIYLDYIETSNFCKENHLRITTDKDYCSDGKILRKIVYIQDGLFSNPKRVLAKEIVQLEEYP